MDSSAAVIASCRYRHPDLGTVCVRVNGRAKAVRARWVGPEVHITVPANYPSEAYERFISDYKERIASMRPQRRFADGQIIKGSVAQFVIRRGLTATGNTVSIIPAPTTQEGSHCYNIVVSPSADFHGEKTEQMINAALLAAAQHATRHYIVPLAARLARSLGCLVLGWEVKDSPVALGRCSYRGYITLSPRLAFLPAELRDFVICHELAHLTELNHSAAFHEICNSYCNGREAELQKAVRNFPFPVF